MTINLTNSINVYIIGFVSHFIDLCSLMGIKTKIHERLKSHIECKMSSHIDTHGHKHMHRILHYTNCAYHNRSHLGELVIVLFVGFLTFMLASNPGLPNNVSFDYPLKKVSTLECRTLYWDDMPDNCKIDLPIIHGANYNKYKDMPGYRDIYTALWAAPYHDGWNQNIGSHAGVDIATARGTPLYSIGNGRVYFAGWNSAYGNVVRIKYLYKGEYIYVTYAHMDTIEVKQGENVMRGKRIGTVGNSGNTFGLLGGYHVHFQVSKDAGGRPKYSYLDCPDLDKGHYKIIQEGLCREQLLANEYDPIRLIEGVFSLPVLVDNLPSNDTGMQQIVDVAVPVDVVVGTSVNVIDTIKPIIPPSTDKEIKKQNLILDVSNLDKYSEHYWNQNEIWIETDLSGRNLKIGEESLIVLNINKKNPTQKYSGILTVPFSLISTNTNISISLSNIRLVNDGRVEIKIKGNNIGPSTVLINFGGNRIARFGLNVVN